LRFEFVLDGTLRLLGCDKSDGLERRGRSVFAAPPPVLRILHGSTDPQGAPDDSARP
jgi:hypothetical protein